MQPTFRSLTESDLDRIVDLNNAATPAVPVTSRADMHTHVAASTHAIAVVDAARSADGVAGFVILFAPGLGYESENYRYFESRGTDHLYVDRIVIDEARRGEGIGRQLYARVFDLAAAEGRTEVTCEVNVEPPNPGSLAFHARLGFVEVGRQSTKGGAVKVALLAAPVPTAPRSAAHATE